jgi:hypothetical protein
MNIFILILKWGGGLSSFIGLDSISSLSGLAWSHTYVPLYFLLDRRGVVRASLEYRMNESGQILNPPHWKYYRSATVRSL